MVPMHGPLPVETAPAPVAMRPRCDNCGAALAGPYCHECGQRDRDHLATVKEFFAHVAEVAVGYDSRLLRTARALFTQPGLLTAEYIAGRRARYAAPLQTYLLAAALLFASATVRPIVTFNPVTHTFRSGIATLGVEHRLTPDDVAEIRARGMPVELFGERVSAATTSHLSTFLALIVPLFALAVAATFLRSGRPFAHHVLFALHWTAFNLFIVALLQLFPRQRIMGAPVLLALLVLPFGYLVLALRRVYGSGWPGAIARAAPLFLAYQAMLLSWLNFVTVFTRNHILS